jgi:Skp family chaperone for outer membrane proteins
MFQLEMYYMKHESNLFLFAITALVTLSLLVFPSTNMIAYSQSGNQTQGNDQAQQKLFELTQKFNKLLKDSNVNLTLPQDELSSKVQELANSSAFKSLSEKFSQAVQDLGQGNKTEQLKQQAGANLSKLVQKLEDLKVNSTQ